MTFYVLGLNHDTAPLAVRQAFALDDDALSTLYRTLDLSESAELVLISTCNRTEAYLYGTEADVRAVKSGLCMAARTPWPEANTFLHDDEAAVRHILQVACGLRSLVLGDAQILAQIKEAYRLATAEDRVGAVLHRLMHTALRTAKRVVHETALTDGTASVPSAAVALARSFAEAEGWPGLQGRTVLVLGAGQMGRLAAEVVKAEHPGRLLVANRSADRAQALAASLDAEWIDWDERGAAVTASDVVFVATGAAAPVLTAASLPDACPSSPVLLVDLAVPRNVDRAVDALPGYTVVDLDRLQAHRDEVRAQRRAEVPAAEALCEDALAEFVTWVFHQQGMQPAIQAIRDTFEAIRIQEIERHHHRFAETDRADLDRLTRSILQKVLAVPVVRLKSVDPESIDFVRGIKLLHALFTRKDCEDASVRDADVLLGRASQLLAAPPVASPARCPFETHWQTGGAHQLHDALRVAAPLCPRTAEAAGDEEA